MTPIVETGATKFLLEPNLKTCRMIGAVRCAALAKKLSAGCRKKVKLHTFFPVDQDSAIGLQHDCSVIAQPGAIFIIASQKPGSSGLQPGL